jgi:hypothetical protein
MSEIADWNIAQHTTTHFFEWCPEPRRLDALMVAVRSFATPPTTCEVMGRPFSAPEAMNMARAQYNMYERASVSIDDFRSVSKRSFELEISAYSDRMIRPVCGPIGGASWGIGVIFPHQIHLARKRHSHALDVEAAMACHVAMIDVEDVLTRICMADTTNHDRRVQQWECLERTYRNGSDVQCRRPCCPRPCLIMDLLT